MDTDKNMLSKQRNNLQQLANIRCYNLTNIAINL